MLRKQRDASHISKLLKPNIRVVIDSPLESTSAAAVPKMGTTLQTKLWNQRLLKTTWFWSSLLYIIITESQRNLTQSIELWCGYFLLHSVIWWVLLWCYMMREALTEINMDTLTSHLRVQPADSDSVITGLYTDCRGRKWMRRNENCMRREFVQCALTLPSESNINVRYVCRRNDVTLHLY